MDTRRSECEEDKESISFHVRSISPKKCNKLLTVGKWSQKYSKDALILVLVAVAQNLADNYKKSSDKSNTSNMDWTKGEPV